MRQPKRTLDAKALWTLRNQPSPADLAYGGASAPDTAHSSAVNYTLITSSPEHMVYTFRLGRSAFGDGHVLGRRRWFG
jgi:hypothetical protein